MKQRGTGKSGSGLRVIIVIILALLLGGTLYGQEGNKGENSNWIETLGNRLTQAVFPVLSYNGSQSRDDLIVKTFELLGNTLFPSVSYINNASGNTIETITELYPSAEDLAMMCEENNNYEELEKQAEEQKAAQGESSDAVQAVSGAADGIIYPLDSLKDYNFLINNFYVVDSTASVDSSLLDGETLVGQDLTMDVTGDEPKILIYHSHSQESFADSKDGDEYGTVIGLGNTLTSLLEDKYGISVYHDKGVYDIINGQLDRSAAYSNALDTVEKILEENPSIMVVIDLHRDGVREGTHLVTEVNGKQTAKIMFFNGVTRSSTSGENSYLYNPYLTENLAFSLQMQLKAAELYPDLTRRIYLRPYRYNMHVKPRTLLVECGAQTNTVEEVHNAMEPLADILYSVLTGQ